MSSMLVSGFFHSRESTFSLLINRNRETTWMQNKVIESFYFSGLVKMGAFINATYLFISWKRVAVSSIFCYCLYNQWYLHRNNKTSETQAVYSDRKDELSYKTMFNKYATFAVYWNHFCVNTWVYCSFK